MSVSTERGFTIIEVILTMAITALLMFALMGGWVLSLNTQSYRDSARSLSTTLEAQFTAASDVRNDRVSAGCTSGGVNNTYLSRGTTNCVIMGRYVYVDGAGGDDRVVSTAIIGVEPATEPDPSLSDQAVIALYNPARLRENFLPSQSEPVGWSSQLYVVGDYPGDDDTPYSRVIAILRSPKTGLTYTYSRNYEGPVANLPSVQTIMSSGDTSRQIICLNPETFTQGPRIGITIDANASSSAAVKIVADGSVRC